jgi:hypothetical protein
MDSLPLMIGIGVLVGWNSVLTVLFLRQSGKLQRVTKNGKRETLLEVLSEVLESERKLSKSLTGISKQVEDLIFNSQFYIQKIGLVRFNPFNDTGGDQSFILALVDDKDSGVVISGLHTRNGTRWYAKKVQGGKGVEHELSSDELKAIKSATKRHKK